MSEIKVELQGVQKFYPAQARAIPPVSQGTNASTEGKLALSHIDLVLHQGERIGIVGPNGAGKSTLLHIIAGLASPTAGTVQINGHVTAIMTLGVGLREDLTGRENIFIDGELHNRSKQQMQAVAEEIIAFSELGEFIDYPVRSYSTGMKARLAFSMISHIDPEILIIDEALSVGDASFSTKATARIMDICARGKIVILVSHSMESVRSICNRCIWLQDGKVIQEGSPEAVTSAYIDSVRKADDALLMLRFRKLVGNRSLAPGYRIDMVALRSGGRNDPRVLLEARQPCVIAVRATAPETDGHLRLSVRIRRFDDVLMFDESFDAATIGSTPQALALELVMQELALGVAIYRLDVQLERDRIPLAQDSQVFEVFTAKAPTGGKPMLYSAVHSTVTRSALQP